MKRAFHKTSSALGFDRFFAFLNRNRPIVLAFHGVTAEAPGSIHNYEGSHLYRPVFSRLVEHLVRRYRIVSLDQIADWLGGAGGLPQRAVALTFDDGYRNVLTHAAPILSALGAPATVFVTTDFVVDGEMLWPDRLLAALDVTSKASVTVPDGAVAREFAIRSKAEKLLANERIRAMCKAMTDDRRLDFVADIVGRLEVDDKALSDVWDDYKPLGADDLRELANHGITVGSHTCSHPVVVRCSQERMSDELERSKRIIEDICGTPCTSFAYPNGAPGDFNDETRRAVVAAGYRCAVTTVKRRVTNDQDQFEIPRYILTHNDITTAEFSVEVSGFPTFLRGLRR